MTKKYEWGTHLHRLTESDKVYINIIYVAILNFIFQNFSGNNNNNNNSFKRGRRRSWRRSMSNERNIILINLYNIWTFCTMRTF